MTAMQISVNKNKKNSRLVRVLILPTKATQQLISQAAICPHMLQAFIEITRRGLGPC
jgi:hypothetical protein